MPEKTEAELREIKALVDSGAAYEDFPDGATWADLELAEQLEEDPDAQ